MGERRKKEKYLEQLFSELEVPEWEDIPGTH